MKGFSELLRLQVNRPLIRLQVALDELAESMVYYKTKGLVG